MKREKNVDYVIVGGGSAGSVLANRLSADPQLNVQLLEAGPSDSSLKIRMPAATPYVIADPNMNWHYYSEPLKNLNQRRVLCPRGRVLGGCSAHNALVFIRGHARDYDNWRQLGCPGWSYADVLGYFQRSETRSVGGDDYRGEQGPMQVQPARDPNPLHEAYLEAARQAGHPYTRDFNGHQQEGVGRFDVNIDRGNRCSTAHAYLKPARSRENLEIIVNAFVVRILFNGTRAVGVEYIKNGTLKQVLVEREVILSAGAINSPQLLMLSGIGDADHLRKFGIEVVLDQPNVGKNLQDHVDLAVQHECQLPVTLYGVNKWNRAVGIALEWFLFRTGPGASAHIETGAFLRSEKNHETPDIQQQFVPMFVVDHGLNWQDRHGYQLYSLLLRPESRGYVRLRCANPQAHPIMELNLLDSEQDRHTLREGVKLAREILRQPAFDPFRGRELLPGESCVSDADIDAFVREQANSAYHVCGTCKMGTDEQAVVGPDLSGSWMRRSCLPW